MRGTGASGGGTSRRPTHTLRATHCCLACLTSLVVADVTSPRPSDSPGHLVASRVVDVGSKSVSIGTHSRPADIVVGRHQTEAAQAQTQAPRGSKAARPGPAGLRLLRCCRCCPARRGGAEAVRWSPRRGRQHGVLGTPLRAGCLPGRWQALPAPSAARCCVCLSLAVEGVEDARGARCMSFGWPDHRQAAQALLSASQSGR